MYLLKIEPNPCADANVADWEDLRFFLAIARAGSLAGAARALVVNHSTMFRRLNAMEERLGVRLFERLPQGYVVTAAGEEVRRHAETAEAAVLAAERGIAGGDVRLSGEIRLTTAANLAADYVAPLMPAFRQRYPGIVVEIAVSDTDFDMNRREADLALRATRKPPEFLVGRRVVTVPWYACASAAYLKRRGRPADADDLAGHDLIGADAAFGRLSVFAWLRETFPPEAVVLRCNELNTMAALAQAGAGIALLPGDNARRGLDRLFRLDARFDGSLWLLTHPDLRHTARVKALADFLFENLRADGRLAPFLAEEAAAAPAPGTRKARRR